MAKVVTSELYRCAGEALPTSDTMGKPRSHSASSQHEERGLGEVGRSEGAGGYRSFGSRIPAEEDGQMSEVAVSCT